MSVTLKPTNQCDSFGLFDCKTISLVNAYEADVDEARRHVVFTYSQFISSSPYRVYARFITLGGIFDHLLAERLPGEDTE